MSHSFNRPRPLLPSRARASITYLHKRRNFPFTYFAVVFPPMINFPLARQALARSPVARPYRPRNARRAHCVAINQEEGSEIGGEEAGTGRLLHKSTTRRPRKTDLAGSSKQTRTRCSCAWLNPSPFAEVVTVFRTLDSRDRGHFLTWLGRVRRKVDDGLAAVLAKDEEKALKGMAVGEGNEENDAKIGVYLPAPPRDADGADGGGETNAPFVFGSEASFFSSSVTLGVEGAPVGAGEAAGNTSTSGAAICSRYCMCLPWCGYGVRVS